MKRVALLLLLVIVGCGGGGSSTSSSTATTLPDLIVTGTMTMPGYFGDPGHLCEGSNVHHTEDLAVGAQVTVTDENNKIIATSKLVAGAVDHQQQCVMPFSVLVPKGPTFYGFEIAHRGKVTFPADQLLREQRVALKL